MKIYTTNDMSVAAYLLMNGCKIIKIKKSNPYIFEFDDTSKNCEKFALMFLSSECSKYDGYLRMLRGMIRSQP